MKLHYFKILLFFLPLNILVTSYQAHNNNKPSITHHRQTNRSLCECELYAPANYDSDPQMKEVIEHFNKQTQQRFHEYDDRMIGKRKQCKEQFDKEIQKIILKDKLEKELSEKLATLHTDIQNDAIPTCVCEKSLADKVEKGCLRCGYGLGTVAPTVGLIGSVAIGAWKNAATVSAMEYAAKKGIEAGIATVIAKIKEMNPLKSLWSAEWSKYITDLNYKSIDGLAAAAESALNSIGETCAPNAERMSIACNAISADNRSMWFGTAVRDAADITASRTEIVQKAAMGTIENTTTTSTTVITASVVAIVVIVLIMVIIYLILRYRRKKKMKKKLQYIKLLEE
ncbi:rifin PIR protein, putative [Plasmodium reichenowi]|uniref:Rifin PIR protein, putative n=1 Tax=Plasmodium reichenowi TaxID=5854 RepID=A0A2P9DSJ5_PLARE|nr:rifin PIR protein, putative [Plasmodium reichenowi]